MPASPQHRGQQHRAPQQQNRGQNTADRQHDRMISAPYNFVPLSSRIFLPAWGQQVSHDIPFQDGISGELHYTLIAETPLLVGGRQTKPGRGMPGEVRPFRLPDGTYAIPGSSIKGMLRSVMEIAAFGRMSKVDEVRPGLRDISKADTVYATRIRGQVKTGFLRRRADGGQEIVPCQMVRLNHRDLEVALDVPKPIFSIRQCVAAKYARWRELCQKRGKDPEILLFEVGHPDATKLFKGSLRGVPVFTGQISDSTKPGGKYRDFVFYAPDPQQAIPVPPEAWRDFLRIHGDEDNNRDMSWPGYWKQKHREGKQIPVFYLQDGPLLRIGLAYMPKLAGDFSTHDLICHTNPAHLQESGTEDGYDLADLLFGAINSRNQADALRGRVSCETALAEGKPDTQQQNDTILNGPKPSYFPNYLTQPVDPGKWTLKDKEPYVTYIRTDKSQAPTLRGFKRYPVRPVADTRVQELAAEQHGNTKVQVRLHTLPPQTRFHGRIVFHNLKPVELGALLWVLTWGGKTELRHSLGMGKPFGFGQVRIDLQADRCRLIPNDPTQPETTLTPEWSERFMAEFVQLMKAEIPDWERSPQILNLLAMANPQSATKLPKGMELRHMRLDAKQRINEFQVAKQNRLVLADYAVVTGAWNINDFRLPQGASGHAPRPHAVAGRGATTAATAPATPAVATVREETVVWNNVVLTWTKGSQTLKAAAPQRGSATAVQAHARALLDRLPPDQRARLEKKGELKGAQATVTVKGNSYFLTGLDWPEPH